MSQPVLLLTVKPVSVFQGQGFHQFGKTGESMALFDVTKGLTPCQTLVDIEDNFTTLRVVSAWVIQPKEEVCNG